MARPPRGIRGGRATTAAPRGGRPIPTESRAEPSSTTSIPTKAENESIPPTPTTAGVEPSSSTSTVSTGSKKAKAFDLEKWLVSVGKAEYWKDFKKVAVDGYPVGECMHCHTHIKAHPSRNGTSAMDNHRESCLAKVAASSNQTVLNLQTSGGGQS